MKRVGHTPGRLPHWGGCRASGLVRADGGAAAVTHSTRDSHSHTTEDQNNTETRTMRHTQAKLMNREWPALTSELLDIENGVNRTWKRLQSRIFELEFGVRRRGWGELLAQELVNLVSGPLLDAQLATNLSMCIEQTNHWLRAALVLNAHDTLKGGHTGFHKGYNIEQENN